MVNSVYRRFLIGVLPLLEQAYVFGKSIVPRHTTCVWSLAKHIHTMEVMTHITDFIDDEEKELFETIESEDFAPGESIATPELLEQMRTAARNTLNESSEKISIRIAQSDLARVKARALREGIPYQTLIKAIIHRAVR